VVTDQTEIDMPTPEELARQNIDAQLNTCGWVIQDRTTINLRAGRGVASTAGDIEAGV
jgi:type I restriction enzyme R subunit